MENAQYIEGTHLKIATIILIVVREKYLVRWNNDVNKRNWSSEVACQLCPKEDSTGHLLVGEE